MSKNCPKCGKLIEDNEKFCKECTEKKEKPKNYLFPIIIGVIALIIVIIVGAIALSEDGYKEHDFGKFSLEIPEEDDFRVTKWNHRVGSSNTYQWKNNDNSIIIDQTVTYTDKEATKNGVIRILQSYGYDKTNTDVHKGVLLTSPTNNILIIETSSGMLAITGKDVNVIEHMGKSYKVT